MKQSLVCFSFICCVCITAAEPKFSAPTTVTHAGDNTIISFAISEKSDVEVSILNSKDKVVRHLAASVLGGEQVPSAPLKPGLSQTISWDGKDDFGRRVQGGTFKVRVRAGTQFKFGRFIGDDPYTFGSVDGIACDEEGNIYIEGNRGTHNQAVRTVRKYDSNGGYLKELLPFPSDLPADAMKEIAVFDERGNRWLPRSISCLNPEFYESGQFVAASMKAGLLFSGTQDVMRLAPDGSVSGKSFGLGQNPWPVFDANDSQKNHYEHPWHYHEGSAHYSASPDGKWLYLTGPYPNAEKRKKMDARFPLGGVYRMRLDGRDDMKLFVSVPANFDGPWLKEGGKLYSGSTPLGFVGSDAKGNIYVPDRQSNRIVVFNENGDQLGEIAVKNPYQVAIHPTTGAIYVLRMVCNGWNTHAIALDKFNNYEKGATSVATYDKINNKTVPFIAVSLKEGRTTLWIAGSPEGLIALQDTGNAVIPIETKFKRRSQSQIDWSRLAVDYDRDELYVADGGNLIWRYDGISGDGSILERNGKPLAAVDLAVGYDGVLYIRTGEGFSGPLERYTRDLQPAPASSGTNSLSKYIYSRFGIGNCEKGLGIGPNGECYISFMYNWTKYCVAGFGKDGKPIKGKYLQGKVGNQPGAKTDPNTTYPSDLDSAVIGPIPQSGGGVRVDLQGNIYLGLAVKPKGQKVPELLAKMDVNRAWTGSVIKFGPGGGAVLGVPDAVSIQADMPRIELENKLIAENALNAYWGLGSMSGAGPGGNSSCCVCRVPRFDVDRFGRVALPSSYTSSIMLYDNAGNIIAEFGKYGNFDAQYVNPETPAGKKGKPTIGVPEIPMAFPTGAGFSENHLYVNDTANRRVVRIDLGFAAETVVEIK